MTLSHLFVYPNRDTGTPCSQYAKFDSDDEAVEKAVEFVNGEDMPDRVIVIEIRDDGHTRFIADVQSELVLEQVLVEKRKAVVKR